MKILAQLVIGLGLIGTSQAQTAQAQTAQAQTAQAQTAQAQTDQAQTDQAQTGEAQAGQAQPRPARVELLPIPNTLPGILFDPAPLSGSFTPLATGQAEALRRATDTPGATSEPAVAVTTAPVQPVAVAPAVEPQAPAAAPTTPVTPVPEAPAAAEPDVEAAPEPAPAPPKKAAEPATTSVTVIVEGVESAKGVVNVALCNTGLSSEGCPYTKSTPAAAGFVEARFDDVPPGVYAVVGYHDVNNNDEFDKMLGVPREPYALSSKAADMLAPGFKDAALNIKKGDNTVIIRMQRLGG